MPAYSFGSRTPNKRPVRIPAPNTYRIPEVIGGKYIFYRRAPSHNIHSKFKIKKYNVTPAPNAYNLQHFKKGRSAPAYSMGCKLPELNQTYEADYKFK